MGHDGEEDAALIKKLQEELWSECQKDKNKITTDVKARQERFNREVNKFIISVCHFQ